MAGSESRIAVNNDSGGEGNVSAASMATEAFIARKEAELQAAINSQYAKMRGQEKELRELQLQLKVTTGPKKSALEHLRKLIEVQTEKVRYFCRRLVNSDRWSLIRID